MPFPYAFPWGGADARPSVRPFTSAFGVEEAEVDFGQDISMLDDVDAVLSLVDGVANLGQALAGRLQTERGSLFYDQNYGTDLREYLNDVVTPASLSAARVDAQSESGKDERVLACSATTAYVPDENMMTVRLAGQTDAGPFVLVLGVTAVSVSVLQSGG